MNDPCGPSYDPSSGLYHLFYQYHPGYIVWGNISWGHATSEDLVTWTDINGWQAYDSVALAPGPQGSLDGSGVYTGSAQFLATNESWGLPTQEEADNSEQDLMLIFYTAVNGSNETQTLAMSYDGGYTFSKLEGTGININPVIANPPPNLSVTGFRDPHLEPWPEMDSILDADEPHFYAVIGSGITDVGPRLQFYTAPASNMTQWTYLGPLFSAAGNASWSETYSGTYGYNFEVPGAFSLPELVENGGDGVTLHYFVTMGSDASTFLHPLTNWPLWSEINITRSTNGSAEGTILSSGVIDWGQSYAWNSFYDKPHDRRIGFGWIPEDLGAPALRPQGWVGATTLPRELYVQVYQNLANTNGILSQHGSWTAVQDSNNRWNMTTLAMRPAPDVVAALQQNATVTRAESIPMSASTQLQFYSLNVSSDSIIIHAEIDIPTNATSDVGFVLRRSPDGEEQTLITYDPVRETLTMNLTSSTLLNSTFVGTANHIAPLFPPRDVRLGQQL
ncbi:hypothetical protein EVJ58_g2592 [Rhodofomes roseus]|uniref:Uncharacterized protein n=1 Tax=Rhodofomes roseus TaxID=34475 RepID=A0A4Y9YSH9_9APHY|nr:hypothetical protein EVJ58_g2592 [Rhodofomes roseus]